MNIELIVAAVTLFGIILILVGAWRVSNQGGSCRKPEKIEINRPDPSPSPPPKWETKILKLKCRCGSSLEIDRSGKDFDLTIEVIKMFEKMHLQCIGTCTADMIKEKL